MSVCICIYKPRLDITFNENGWSDKKRHDMIDISLLNLIYRKNKSWKKYRNKLMSIGYHNFKDRYMISNYIPVDQVHYYQGWWLRNSFFHKKCTSIFCLNKKEIENFFRKYVKNCMYPIKQDILDSWEDGMIFECSW